MKLSEISAVVVYLLSLIKKDNVKILRNIVVRENMIVHNWVAFGLKILHQLVNDRDRLLAGSEPSG